MNTDEMLRSAAAHYINEAGAAENLLQKNLQDLFAILANTVTDPKTFKDSTTNFHTEIDYDEMFRGNAAVDLGKRIFYRWSVALQMFVCEGGDEDKDLRAQLASAVFKKGGGAAAMVAGTLVASFGLSPAVAAVISALLLKLFVAPVADEVCITWKNFNESQKESNIKS